ncbi:hypothetical protein SDC9_115736 [bioreactor metagenome]|uniref:Uncharacterized protein n=1 Tax=bioreactor metagenome TaxID=1076179 RepID=A0A645BU79_9ZZZZ
MLLEQAQPHERQRDRQQAGDRRDGGEQHRLHRPDQAQQQRVDDRVRHPGDGGVEQHPVADRRVGPAGLVVHVPGPDQGRGPDAGPDRDEGEHGVRGVRQPEPQHRAQADREGADHLLGVAAFRHRDATAHLQAGQQDRHAEADQRGVQRRGHHHQGGDHPQHDEPAGEGHPPRGPRCAEPGLDDDGEGQLPEERPGHHERRDDALGLGVEQPRRDRQGGGRDDRQGRPADHRPGAAQGAPYAELAQVDRPDHRGTAVRVRPSRGADTRPTKPSSRPRKAHQPSSGRWVEPWRRPITRPAATKASRHHNGYDQRARIRDVPRL